MIEFQNVSMAYKDRPVLNHVDLTIQDSEFFVLIGSSGCGKTTLLRLLKKELSPNGTKEGEIFFEGRTLEELEDYRSASEIGFVLQNPDAKYQPHVTASLLRALHPASI